MSKRYWSLVAAVAVLAAIAGVYVASALRNPDPVSLSSGTAYPVPTPLEPFRLMDSEGREVTPETLSGQPTLVFFGFTHCPDVCPTTLAQLVSIQKRDDVPRFKVALITVDPERDTPEQIGKYVASFGGDIIGLTGSMPEIVKAQKTFATAASRTDEPGGGYRMDHSATVIVLDSGARKVAVFTPPLRPDAMARDLVALAPTLRNR